MATPYTSLQVTSALLNSLNLLEQFQSIDVNPENTLVDARGIADRYENNQVTKQKQTLNFMYHWYDTVGSINLEASNLNISLWTLGGTAYLGQLKSGSFEVTNTGPEVSGIAVLDEYTIPTKTAVALTSDIMVVTEAYFTNQMLTATGNGFKVTVAFTFAGELVTFSGILRATGHKVVRGEVQMENVSISLAGGTPTTSGDTSSLLYLALVGGAITSFDIATGTNEYKTGVSQYAMISKYALRFQDKALIEQNVTVEVQGGMTVVAGG